MLALNGGLDLRTPTSVSYLRSLAAAQRTLQSRIESTLPAANVRWHYSANGSDGKWSATSKVVPLSG